MAISFSCGQMPEADWFYIPLDLRARWAGTSRFSVDLAADYFDVSVLHGAVIRLVTLYPERLKNDPRTAYRCGGEAGTSEADTPVVRYMRKCVMCRAIYIKLQAGEW
jgi:hypothetical protein